MNNRKKVTMKMLFITFFYAIISCEIRMMNS